MRKCTLNQKHIQWSWKFLCDINMLNTSIMQKIGIRKAQLTCIWKWTRSTSKCVTHIVTPCIHVSKTEMENAKNAKPILKNQATCIEQAYQISRQLEEVWAFHKTNGTTYHILHHVQTSTHNWKSSKEKIREFILKKTRHSNEHVTKIWINLELFSIFYEFLNLSKINEIMWQSMEMILWIKMETATVTDWTLVLKVIGASEINWNCETIQSQVSNREHGASHALWLERCV